MLVSLIINLKRGPWSAVFVELLIFGFLISRKVAAFAVFGALSVLLFIIPARERLLDLVTDFTISGGRQVMWSLALELTERFPLGLGLDNAEYMRELDSSLPESHRHMHSNILNIVVETGWLGLVFFLCWIFAAIRIGFRLWRTKPKLEPDLLRLGVCTSIALCGWQIAGLVEYNFGDGEVRLIALSLIGVLLTIDHLAKTGSTN